MFLIMSLLLSCEILIKIATKLEKLQLFSSIYPNEKQVKFQML